MKPLAFCGVALILLALASCTASNSAAPPAAITLKSPDGKYQLSLPEGWAAMDFHLSNVQIGAANQQRGEYVEVIAERPADYIGPFAIYAQAKCDTMAGSLIDPRVKSGQSMHINGCPAYQFEIHGLIPDSQLKVGYLLTVLKGKTHYLQVVGWSAEDNFSGDKQDLVRLGEGLAEPQGPAPIGGAG